MIERMSTVNNLYDRKGKGFREMLAFFLLPSSFFIFLLIFCLGFSTAFAQEPERVTIDGSALHAGEAFRFTVTVNSDEMVSFADAQSWLTAVLCPSGETAGSCQTLSMNVEGSDDTVMRVVFTAEELPSAGDYTLDVSFTDLTGGFAQQSASYLITGVQEAESPEPTSTPTNEPELLIGPAPDALPTPTAGEPVQETEPTAVPETTEPGNEAAVTETSVPEIETAQPEMEPAQPTEPVQPTQEPIMPDFDPDQPTVTINVTLTPAMVDESGNNLIYGSTLYVGESYLLQIASDVPMNDSVTVEVAFPAAFANAPLDPESGCMMYINAEGNGLSIPGSFWNAENGSTFRCELRFTDSTWLPSQPYSFTIKTTGLPTNETFQMAPLNWNYYPVNIAKYAATHQVQISDSRGNQICSDTVPCTAFNADDIYTFTYKFPADWGAALPSGKSFSADVQWPAEWSSGLQLSAAYDDAAQIGNACEVGPDGITHFDLEEVSPGRYAASCTFAPSTISNPVQSAAVLHLDDNAWQVTDLNITMPGLIVKKQAVLTPSLTMRVTEDAAEEEQIRGGTINSLYKTTVDMANNGNGFGTPALYTLKAQVEGVSAAREPQPGDRVRVNWGVLDVLAQTGDLPACLVPDGKGYALGSLNQTADGIWQAECSFRFPRNMSENTAGGVLQMELLSGMYSTTASTGVTSLPFAKKTLAINLDIPQRMVPANPMMMRASLADESGGISDYTRAVLNQTGALVTSTWEYNTATSCQGVYDLSANGEADCSVMFEAPVYTASTMHFDLASPELRELFNVQFRPAADVYIASVSRLNVSVAPSLTLRMTPDDQPAEQISGGWVSGLYRTAEDTPNLSLTSDAPARYSLRANISGVLNGSQPQPGDYVRVRWNMLDALSQSGDLPSCLAPMSDGYMLGMLEQSEENTWTAACDFYFPQTMSDTITAASMSMDLVSTAYEGTGSAQMYGNAFKRQNLYVDLTIPEHMLVRQMTELRVKVSDDSGSFSDYSRAILNSFGASLRSDWEYNYVTTCQGLYSFEMDGTSTCSAWFDTPTTGDSDMHFEFISPALENLFKVTYRPSADFHIPAITNPKAVLSVKLFHAGTEIPLPASGDEMFHVGEAYQFQFYLTPENEYRDVLNAVSVDNEGLVLDWWEPLRIHWGMIPGGETTLNFYRDGDRFIARYDFSFEQGDLDLQGILGQLVVECLIEGWDVSGVNDMVPIQLPSRIDKQPVSLQISDFIVDEFGTTVRDVTVNKTAEFDVTFSGSLDHFDATRLNVGYDANGIRTPIDCFPDYEQGKLHCSFIPVCTDYTYDNYGSVCGTGLSLYADYTGDPYNGAASVEPKIFNVKREEIRFSSAKEGSLSEFDLYRIQEAAPDLMSFENTGLRAETWTIESFLPREIRRMGDIESKSYPVIFKYELNGEDPLDDTLLRLDVHYQTGSYLQPVDETITLTPRMVTSDTVMFELDFGSYEMLDDGRTVRDALANAVTITGLEVRYPGSPMVGPASARYEAENVTFALKIAAVLDMDTDLSSPGVVRFDGSAAAELQTQSFAVYCSQLYQPLQCSAELPLDVTNDNGEPLLSEVVDDGCWGKIRTKVGNAEIYVNNSFYPQCYLTNWTDDGGIVIAGEF